MKRKAFQLAALLLTLLQVVSCGGGYMYFRPVKEQKRAEQTGMATANTAPTALEIFSCLSLSLRYCFIMHYSGCVARITL